MRILGIDPGSRICGWGIIEETREARNLRHIDCGIVTTKSSVDFPTRLGTIFDGIEKVIEEYRPDQACIENVFYQKNARSALILGQARGAAIVACHKSGLKVFEYSPAQIKQAVCGYGRAEKQQVARMVMAILGLPEIAQADASDALACAICHSSSYRFAAAIKQAK